MSDGQYTKVGPWVNGAPPALSAANLDIVEEQHEEAAYIPSARMIPPVVRWVTPGWSWLGQGNTAITANRIYYQVIYVPESVSYDRIGIYVGVGDGAGGTIDLRIFEWTTGVPSTLVLSAGTVNSNAAAAKEIVIAQTLTQGLYFLACRGDNTPSLVAPAAGRVERLPVTGLSTTNASGAIGQPILYDDAAYADPAGAVDGILDCTYAFMRLREA